MTCCGEPAVEHAATVVVAAPCVNQRDEEVLQVLLTVPRHLAPKNR